MVNNTVYVGGSFTNARPAGAAAGQNPWPAATSCAFDVTTGQLIASFAPMVQRPDPRHGSVPGQDPPLRRR